MFFMLENKKGTFGIFYSLYFRQNVVPWFSEKQKFMYLSTYFVQFQEQFLKSNKGQKNLSNLILCFF